MRNNPYLPTLISYPHLPKYAFIRLMCVGFVMALCMVTIVSAVHAQSDDRAALVDRINFLERQIRYLSDRVNAVSAQTNRPRSGTVDQPGAIGTGDAAANARLSVRLSQLENDIRSVTGRLEELSFQVRDLNERVNRMTANQEYQPGQVTLANPQSDTDPGPGPEPGSPDSVATAPARPPQFDGNQTAGQDGARPRVLGTFPGDNQSGSAGQGATSGAPDETAQASPRQQYAYAFNLLRAKKYGEAEAAFQQFLDRHPGGPLTQNAHYWLGETYYAQNEYTRAATTFLEGYELDKSGTKAPDTLLKLGMSLGRLGKTREACATFKELEGVFPNVPTAIATTAKEEKNRFGCS